MPPEAPRTTAAVAMSCSSPPFGLLLPCDTVLPKETKEGVCKGLCSLIKGQSLKHKAFSNASLCPGTGERKVTVLHVAGQDQNRGLG